MAGVKQDKKTKNYTHGHRNRLRERFRKGGADALPDYELLELLLFRAIPQRDVKPLAKELIDKFGSFAQTISAPPERLKETSGLGEASITEFKLVQAAALRLMQAEIKDKPVIGSWSKLIDYCTAAMAYQSKEQFRVLYLNRKNVLIEDEVLQEGTIDHTPVYPREVVKRALELGASSMILVHNHPSGDVTPSQADIDMTRKIVEAAKSLNINVHDHLIIGKDQHASFKALKLL